MQAVLKGTGAVERSFSNSLYAEKLTSVSKSEIGYEFRGGGCLSKNPAVVFLKIALA